MQGRSPPLFLLGTSLSWLGKKIFVESNCREGGKQVTLWKANYLSVGGRLALIKSVLSNLPVYFISLFKCPISVINHIEKLQRDFLWQGRSGGKKFHLVDWASVCKPKQEGGLGIRPLREMNRALLGKWLWRLGNESEGLWRDMMLAKYGGSRDGWDFHYASYRSSNIWKGITSVQEDFKRNLKYRVGSGEKVRFWLDNWFGNRPLAAQFPDLTKYAMDKEATVSSYLETIGSGSQLIWSPIFRRNPKENEESQLLLLLNVLSSIFIPGEQDERVWTSSRES